MTDRDALLTAGIDVGSATVKVAVVATTTAGGETVVAADYERIRRRDPAAVATGLFDQLLDDADLERGALAYVATTGEGELIPFRTGHFYGMTTHARGGLFLDPAARAVIDIGALHTRAVKMDEHAKVLGYRMTSQCASGSGQFLENIARYLGVTLSEIGALSRQADNPEPCSSICAVLAETDVINMVSRGITIPNILRGIHQSMAGRYLRLIVAAGIRDVVLITGGLAADEGLATALRDGAAEQRTPLDIRTHPQSALAGALGAALWGASPARQPAHAEGAPQRRVTDLPRLWSLDGRVAIVAGGAGGIGSAIVDVLARAGARVVAGDRTGRPEPAGATAVVCDVTRRDDVDALVATTVAREGRLDIVVHAAGITRDARITRMSDEDWRLVMATNLDSAFYLLRAAAPAMRQGGGGAVVLVSSINADRGKPGQANYGASKAAMNTLARTAAREFGHHAIRVNAVAPGWIETPLTASLSSDLRQRALDETALGRLGRPEDVAGAVLFLCADVSRHITGQILRVDGGQLIG